MAERLLYRERLSSWKTSLLFAALTVVFILLYRWRWMTAGLDALAVLWACLSAIFLFYVLNYHTLTISLTWEALKLTFGIFSWTVPLENIASCQPDNSLPPLMRYGGAGIHFMLVHKRYRASFNFLEYPRVVIAFKQKAGPVVDISFSTRQPEEVLDLLNQALLLTSS